MLVHTKYILVAGKKVWTIIIWLLLFAFFICVRKSVKANCVCMWVGANCWNIACFCLCGADVVFSIYSHPSTIFFSQSKTHLNKQKSPFNQQILL